MILLVSLEVGLKRINSLSQNCDLNFRRSAVGRMVAVCRDDWSFFLCRDHGFLSLVVRRERLICVLEFEQRRLPNSVTLVNAMWAKG